MTVLRDVAAFQVAAPTVSGGEAMAPGVGEGYS